MEFISVSLARLVAIVSVEALDPRGHVSGPEIFSEIGTTYSFAKSPTTLAEMELQKGVVFQAGRLGDVVIDALTFYPNGIIIDTRSSTDNCEMIFEHIMANARNSLGAIIESTRRHYASQLYFKSDVNMSLLNPAFPVICQRLSRRVSADMKHQLNYEPTALYFNMDTSQLKIPPSQFTIERKVETPFSENTYYSLAPLRSKEHLEFLVEIEVLMQ